MPSHWIPYACNQSGFISIFTEDFLRGIHNAALLDDLPIFKAAATLFFNEEVNNYISSATALGRVGLAQDNGSVVAFICIPEARWINAQRLEVAGGVNI